MSENEELRAGFGTPPELSDDELQNILVDSKEKAVKRVVRRRTGTGVAVAFVLVASALVGNATIWNGRSASNNHDRNRQSSTTTANNHNYTTSVTGGTLIIGGPTSSTTAANGNNGTGGNTQIGSTGTTQSGSTATTKRSSGTTSTTSAASGPSSGQAGNGPLWVTGISANERIPDRITVQAFTSGISPSNVFFYLDGKTKHNDTNGEPWCLFGESGSGCKTASLHLTPNGSTHELKVVAYQGSTTLASLSIPFSY
jgi:hypothetical protein